jgi:hypothetical protein
MTREHDESEERGRAAADQMTALERRARRLLRVYPAAYRRDRGEEIIGTLLEATPDGRTWPRPRDVRALTFSGLKARAAQNKQRSTRANLRVAIMAGLALYVSLWLAEYLDGVVHVSVPTGAFAYSSNSWPPAVTALLAGATVVLAWTAPRVVALAAALAASAAVIGFALAANDPFFMFGPRIVQALSLVGLAALTPRAGHPSRHWLWLPGLLAIFSPLASLGVANGWFDYTWPFLTLELPLLAVIACGLLWVAIDARLIVAVLTCLAVYGLQIPVAEISSGLQGVALGSAPFFGVLLGVAAPAVWLLRRQSARLAR